MIGHVCFLPFSCSGSNTSYHDAIGPLTGNSTTKVVPCLFFAFGVHLPAMFCYDPMADA